MMELETLRLTNACLGADLAAARAEAAAARAEAAIARLEAASARSEATVRATKLEAELAVERATSASLRVAAAPKLGLVTVTDIEKLTNQQRTRLDDGLWDIVKAVMTGGGDQFDASLVTTRNFFASVGLILHEPSWHTAGIPNIQALQTMVTDENRSMAERMTARWHEMQCWASHVTGVRHSVFSNLVVETLLRVAIHRGVIT